jgi:acetyltransferase-like isoleucine patch superfamily enzyme
MTTTTHTPQDSDQLSESSLIVALRNQVAHLRQEMLDKFKRHVSINDLLSDRWETARFYGFGEGTSCYNNVLILGNVVVGKNTWIGPNVVLDGSGGLEIGDYVSISSGVQIYTHHTVEWSNSLGKSEIPRQPTRIGSGVYIGPNSVIQMGVTIGDGAVIGAMSFVNRDVPAHSMAFGTPAKVFKSTPPQP